jgi:translocation and assembly module TamB
MQRAWVIVKRIALGIVLLLGFIAGILLGAVIHLGTEDGRAFVADTLNGLFESIFAGTMVIHEIGDIGFDGIEGVRLSMRDPDGEIVLYVEGADLHLPLLATAWSLLTTSEGISITVDDATVAWAEVSLHTAPSGLLRIEEAFDTGPSDPTQPSTPVTVVVSRAQVRRAWVHGVFGGLWLDADARDAEGSVRIDDDAVRISDARSFVTTRAVPRGADLQGELRAEIEVPAEDIRIEGSFEGLVSTIPASIEGSLRGDRIEGRVALEPAQPEELARLVPELQPRDALALDGRVSGTLEAIGVSLHARLLDGASDGRVLGQATIQPDPLRFVATVALDGVDLAGIDTRAPASNVHARASVWSDNGGHAFDLDLAPSMLSGNLLPPARLRGSFEDGKLEASGRVGTARASAAVAVEADLAAERGHARVRADRVDLAELGALGADLSGTASIDADVTADWSTSPPAVSGKLTGSLHEVAAAGFRVERATFSGTARALAGSPTIEASVRADGVSTSGVELARVTASARGPLTSLDTELTATTADGQDLVASGEVRIGDGVAVEELEVSGLGGPLSGSIQLGDGRMRLSAHGQRVDLGAIALLAGLDGVDGHARIDLDIEQGPAGMRGTVEAELEEGKIGRLEGIDGHLDAQLDGHRLVADAWITWGAIGWLDVSLDPVELGGPITSLESWKRATGSVTLSASAYLSQLHTLERIGLLEDGALPLEGAHGRLVVDASVGRERATSPPDLEVDAETENLVLQGPSQFLGRLQGRPILGPPDWTVSGVNLRASAALRGDTGDGEIELRLSDERGMLLWIDADAEVPYERLWHDDLAELRRRPVMEWLAAVPIHAWLQTAKRKWSDLPPMMRTQDMGGDLRITGYFDGTLAEPRMGLTARSFALESPVVPLDFPVDVVVLAEWKEQEGGAHVKLFAPEYQLLGAHAKIDVDLAALLTGREQPKRWSASARATFCDLPLEGLSMLTGRNVQGLAAGELTVQDLNLATAKLEGDVQLRQLRMSRVSYPSGELKVSMQDGKLEASAILRQEDPGYGRVTAELPVSWKQAIPAIEEGRAARIRIDAKDFRIAALHSFVEGTFEELDGRMTADARLELTDRPRLDGELTLRDGRFQLASFGETFFDTEARVRFSPNGELVLERLVAKSIGGRVEAKGRARFDGLSLQRASAEVRIPEDHKIPIVIEGELYGEASGRFDLAAKSDGDRLRLDVAVPELKLALARSSPDDVQALEPSKHMRIGTHHGGGFRVLPLTPPEEDEDSDAMPILVTVALGNDVWIERERELAVRLRGNPRIEITDRVRVAGTIELSKGRLDVRGRTFYIEHGTVTFSGRRPDNPEVVALASWTAPDGTKVFAEFSGPVKTGELELRSDPPMPKEQILSLIVFGEAGGPGVAGGGSTASTAAGVGGSFVAEGLNEAIDDLTSADLRLGVGSSPSNEATTQLEWLVTHELSLRLAYAIGAPPPGASPDRAYGTVDWRFTTDWSLETTVGDQGSTTVDVLWHHRY